MTEMHPAGTGGVAHAALPDGEYEVDLSESELRFKAKAFGAMWVRGRMPAVAGSLRVEGGRLRGSGAIAADAVETGVGPRDWHLRTSHYLDAANHPTIGLEIADVDPSASPVKCDLTVRGTSSPVYMEVRSVEIEGDKVIIKAGLELDRRPFPMLPPLAGVSRIVYTDLTVVARRRVA